MTTFGYGLLLVGALLLRQVVVGRTKEIPTDMRDLATAFLNADTAGIATVLSARGENVSTDVSGTGSPSDTSVDTTLNTTVPLKGNTALSDKVVELGNRASGYVLGATGPNHYDCSGLIWRACRELGIYTGPRFTTSTFHRAANGWAVQVKSPQVGDIVLWPMHHMGVNLGNGRMYSARSPSKGIGVSSIDGDNQYFHSPAEYWRVKG